MEGERVHHGYLPPARAVGRSEIGDERGRRMRVAPGVRLVDPAWCERAAVQRRVRTRDLQRVVCGREKLQIRRRRRVAAVVGELWQPEAVQVGLVADDEVV